MRAGSNPGFASTFLALCVIRSEGFLISLPRLSTTAATTTPTGHQRRKVTRLSLTPPRKSSNGAGAGSAAAGGDDGGPTSRFGGADDILKTSSRMTRAPLRITPNFQPRDERKSSADMDRDIAYGAFLTEEGLDIAGELLGWCYELDVEICCGCCLAFSTEGSCAAWSLHCSTSSFDYRLAR